MNEPRFSFFSFDFESTSFVDLLSIFSVVVVVEFGFSSKNAGDDDETSGVDVPMNLI